MNLYLLLPVFSCIACSMLAVAILCRDAKHRANRLGAAFTVAGAYWALCEILWGITSDPDLASAFIRISSVGWVSIGPIGLHLYLVLTGRIERAPRGAVGAMYAVAAALVAIDCFTDWTHPGVEPAPWGWSYRVGPAFGVAILYTTSTLAAGIILAVREFRHSISAGVRRQAYTLLGVTAIPLAIASVTDGVLPMLGIMAPRFGVASVTVLIAGITWSFFRYGYSLFAPGAFASEILETLVDGVALVRLDGRIDTANPSMERLAGAAEGGLDGMRIDTILRGVDVGPWEALTGVEAQLVSATAEPVPASVSTSLLQDKRGNPIGVVLVARDLREVQSLRSRLVASDRLAAVGQLAAGIAHEINNPVAFVRANLGSLEQLLETLVSKLPADAAASLQPEIDEGAELLGESMEGVDRVIEIVRNVKGYSHIGSVSDAFQAVDLHGVLGAVVRMAAPQLPSHLEVEHRVPDLPPVLGAPQQLQQVFLNLLMNAIQAVDGEGRVWLAGRATSDRAIVEVGDDGCGIPAETLDRIFDPFYTTKPVGEGTGLGLSISYQIVRSHGGELSVESGRGEGTRFRVALPLAPS